MPCLRSLAGRVALDFRSLDAGTESSAGPSRRRRRPRANTRRSFRLSGAVSDTASRPLGGARVEVMAGPRAGMAAITDDTRSILDAWNLHRHSDGSERRRKGTYQKRLTVPPALPPDRPLPAGNAGEITWSDSRSPCSRTVRRQTSPDVYTLTLTADSACTNLPDEARTAPPPRRRSVPGSPVDDLP